MATVVAELTFVVEIVNVEATEVEAEFSFVVETVVEFPRGFCVVLLTDSIGLEFQPTIAIIGLIIS